MVPLGSGLRAGPKSLGSMHGLSPPLGALRDPGGCRGGKREGQGGSPLPSPALPSPAHQVCGCRTSRGCTAGGMPVNGAPWDPQGLQTVGIILLLCSSLKLLHALGIIDLTGGGGARNGDGGENGDGGAMGTGLQWDADVLVELLFASCPRTACAQEL